MVGIGSFGRKGRRWAMGAVAAFAVMLSATGCSLLRQDGWDDGKRTFDIPIRNATNEAPPYERVMGNPLPDHAWLRERASECETWQVGRNGCGGRVAGTAPMRVARVAHAPHAPHAVRRAAPRCKCLTGRIPGS